MKNLIFSTLIIIASLLSFGHVANATQDAGVSMDAAPTATAAVSANQPPKKAEELTKAEAPREGLNVWQNFRSKEYAFAFGGFCMLLVLGLRLLAETSEKVKGLLEKKWGMLIFAFLICGLVDIGTAAKAGESLGGMTVPSVLGSAMLSAGAWAWGKKDKKTP